MAALALVLLLAPASARAQIHQVGIVEIDGELDGQLHDRLLRAQGPRVARAEDVLLADLQNLHPLLFEINDFNSAVFGGEYLLGIGSHFEAGVGLGYSQRTVPQRLRAT